MSIRILQGDCRQLLATLPAGSVQTCVTSPPYFNQRSYLPAGHPDKALEIGTEETPDEYVAALVEVFREVRRVLRDDGTLFINAGDSYASGGRNYGAGVKPKDLLMVPAMLAFALRADGWYLRSEIVWHKPSAMPESVSDRPTSAHEKVFLLAKNASYFYDAEAIAEPLAPPGPTNPRAKYGGQYPSEARGLGGQQPSKLHGRGKSGDTFSNIDASRGTRNCRNVWTIASSPSPIAHHAMMPPELAERCIKAGTSERGGCPHCGAPWARVVERDSSANTRNERVADYDVPGLAKRSSADRVRRLDGKNYVHVVRATGDWAQSCACPEHKPVPQTVLDPFAGAGTTLLVADRLGRNAVGCELSAEHAATAKRRIVDDAPLLVAAE